jgi:hypothetical protein
MQSMVMSRPLLFNADRNIRPEALVGVGLSLEEVIQDPILLQQMRVCQAYLCSASGLLFWSVIKSFVSTWLSNRTTAGNYVPATAMNEDDCSHVCALSSSYLPEG